MVTGVKFLSNTINSTYKPEAQSTITVTPRINNKLTYDKVSFSGIEKPKYEYADAWYLKDEEIVSQDKFSTTIINKKIKRSLFDIIRNKKYTAKIYDLHLRLREELLKNNTDTVVQNEPTDILKATGLNNEELIKEIDKINSVLDLCPQISNYDENFKIKLGNKIASIEKINNGMSGVIYKIRVPNCKPLALKKYFLHSGGKGAEGPFPEIAIARQMNKDKVNDIPLLYCANPYNKWMLSDFVDKNYNARKGGISFINYIKENNLWLDDINTGMAVKGNNGNICVDFGYIHPVGCCYINYEKIENSDNKNRINNKNYIESEKISGLTKYRNAISYGSNETIEKVKSESKENHEMQLYRDVYKALVGENEEGGEMKVDKETAERIQKNFEKSGFIGDALKIFMLKVV